MSNEIATRQDNLPIEHSAVTPLDMLNNALERGVDSEQLGRFMDLHDRWQAAEAKKAFDKALAEFKKNPPKVINDRTNSQYKSTYSSLANTVNTVNAALSDYGLSATWEYEQTDSLITVTCILAHVDGHSIRTTLSGPPDDSGAKNALQRIKSTTTYLRAATFEAVTGIATFAGNKDDDGNGAVGDKITPSQVADLEALIEEVGADKDGFLRVLKVDQLGDVPVSKYDGAVARLRKRGAQK